MTREQFLADLAWRTQIILCQLCGMAHERCITCAESCFCGRSIHAHNNSR